MDKGKILIIDDDLDILETMGSLLKHDGYEIFCADTVDKGIKSIDDFTPDLIILDVMFPEKKIRGIEAASEIKEKHPNIPIIALTAINREYAFDFDKNDIKADEFINKPIKIEKLEELIKFLAMLF